MKIGLLHNSILPPKTYGGIERIVVNLAREYERRGHQVVIFCRKGSPLTQFEKIELPEDYDGEDIADLIPNDIEFLHSHQPLRARPPVPFLVTIHGNGHRGERYFANTNFLSESHAKNHNAKYYVFNGVDPTLYPFVEKKEDYFVFLARTTWRVKNLKTTIALANDCGFRLEIMGGSGVSRKNIHYNGLVDEPEKIKILANARALIYPTNWDEPCAAAPLEALACGTPVISSVNGCMPELVRSGTGYNCATYSELKDAVRKIDLIQPRSCRASVENFFSLERMAGDYLKLFDRILDKGDLDHKPSYNFDSRSIRWLYKPTVINQMQFTVTGKI